MKKSHNRYFIAAPTESGEALGDTLHQLCQYTKHTSIFNIYALDLYNVIESTGSKPSIIKIAKKYGCKRPYILS